MVTKEKSLYIHFRRYNCFKKPKQQDNGFLLPLANEKICKKIKDLISFLFSFQVLDDDDVEDG